MNLFTVYHKNKLSNILDIFGNVKYFTYIAFACILLGILQNLLLLNQELLLGY